MLEFLRENIIPIMVVVAIAIFAYRFVKLMRRDRKAEEAARKKASQAAADLMADETGADSANSAEVDNELPQDDPDGGEGQ